jgi:hypothetical protein
MGAVSHCIARSPAQKPLSMAVLTALLALAHLLGCECNRKTSAEQHPRAGRAADTTAAAKPTATGSVSLLGELDYCEVRHRGLLVDTGSNSANAHRSFQVGPFHDVRHVMRAGKPSGAIHSNKLGYDFWLEQPTKNIHIQLRAAGGLATRLALSVDGERLGAKRLAQERSIVFDYGPLARELAAGRHELLLRANGRAKGEEPFFLLDWVRVYLPDNAEGHYSPATQQNILRDVALGGEPRRAIALGAPGSVRCGLMPERGARLEVDVGYWGEGEGVAQISAQLGGGQSVILAERKLSGGESSRWTHLDLSLEGMTSQLLALELAALKTDSGRVVFGEPRLVPQSETSAPSPAQNVLLLANAGLSQRLVPPWGTRTGLAHLLKLTEAGVTYDNYRTETTLASAALATLLTGMPAAHHMLQDPAARLPDRVKLISQLLRPTNTKTAFFTNVPYSFEAFGFNRGWGTFRQTSPVKDQPGSAALRQARHWLQEQIDEDPDARRLLVVHTRGAHPPWDVSSEEARLLPPNNYNGVVEPRRAAIILREVRNRRRASRRKLGPNDWRRLEALQLLALQKQDASLGALFDVLKNSGQWDKTLVIWLGDVGMGSAGDVPFTPFPPLSENRITPPLVVKFPTRGPGGRRSKLQVTTSDVAQALFGALGLSPPESGSSPMDRSSLESEDTPRMPRRTGALARHGTDYAYYLGPFRVSGALGETPTLCDLTVDPACQIDWYKEKHFEMEWLWRMALRELNYRLEPTEPLERSAAQLDRDTRAALSVFGL